MIRPFVQRILYRSRADSTVHSVHTVHSDHSVHNASTGQNLHVHVIQKQQQRGFPISFYFLNKVRIFLFSLSLSVVNKIFLLVRVRGVGGIKSRRTGTLSSIQNILNVASNSIRGGGGGHVVFVDAFFKGKVLPRSNTMMMLCYSKPNITNV